ncbi:zinc-binding alcohol dehydrogenase family protein [Bacillaceae bacterium SIJ1]|uniref:zinc-binding alcohol dehydrogenase family protein n=1 Tax=Litoribacterium kuwaitense TaxID=1398745 RepID=UPI0013EB1C7A|nr:zinc-binding alcohol dehydrogenase family protein [Litoribacterium kuwaitense]NGP46542.1 zinc-binding alcohol dehydrogenase family protein [Litoribacterium kuwaitense]
MNEEIMKAVGHVEPLPVQEETCLLDVVTARPQATGYDLLVRVEAVSVNPLDTKLRKKQWPEGEAPVILGFDVAGVVEEVGEHVTSFSPGDAVYYSGDYSRPGGNSEYHLVDNRIVGRKPTSLTYAESAAFPLTTLTAWEALIDRAGLKEGENANEGKTLLMIGAAGGVGSIAVQLARYFGLRVIGTASRSETEAWVRELGAHEVIDHHKPITPQLESIGVTQVDVIFSAQSLSPHWDELAPLMATQGRIVSIVPFNSPIDLNPFLKKAIRFSWESMFARPAFQADDVERQRDILNKMAGLIDEGRIQSTMKEMLAPINAENIRKAHRRIESGKMIGKLVIEGFE